MKVNQFTQLRTFVAGIAAFEDVLIEQHDKIVKEYKKILESNRVYDLYLLKEVLERDNDLYVKKEDLPVLLGLLYATHSNWPPAMCKEDVHLTSAYTVVKKALETRKANNIDS